MGLQAACHEPERESGRRGQALAVLRLRYGSHALEALHYLGAHVRVGVWRDPLTTRGREEPSSEVRAHLRAWGPVALTWHAPC